MRDPIIICDSNLSLKDGVTPGTFDVIRIISRLSSVSSRLAPSDNRGIPCRVEDVMDVSEEIRILCQAHFFPLAQVMRVAQQTFAERSAWDYPNLRRPLDSFFHSRKP